MKLRAKLIFILTLIFCVFAVIMASREFASGKNQLVRFQKHNIALLKVLFNNEIEKTYRYYSLALELLAKNNNILKSFADRDRDGLKNQLISFFNQKLRTEYMTKQMHFHLPDHKSFLRIHNPEFFGDDLTNFRKTVTAASSSKKHVHGLEVGRGGIGIRVVDPVYYEGEFIGTLEIGGDIKDLYGKSPSSLGFKYAVGIYPRVLKNAKRFKSYEDDILIGDMLFIEYSEKSVMEDLREIKELKLTQIMNINNKSYYTDSINLIDFSGEKVGIILLLKDVSADVSYMNWEIFKKSLFAVFAGFLSMIIVLYMAAKYIVAPLERVAKHIRQVDGDTAILKKKLPVESNDEIGSLSYSFNLMSDRLVKSFSRIESQVKEIKLINEELEDRVKSRTEEISAKNIELLNAKIIAEKANMAKSDFLANMSHEIRTPMNSIIGYTHLLSKSPINEKQKEFVENIDMSASNLLTLINEILDFSKIEAGKMELDISEFSIDDVIKSAINTIKIKAASKGIELQIERDPEIPDNLIGDQHKILQILINLGSNAVKFTESGFIRLSVKLVNKNDEHIKICFSVKDTGIGINEDNKSKLFKVFSQTDTSNTRKYGGTGLGLAITKSLIELMGGSINVESKEGEGSDFNFEINLGFTEKTNDTGNENINICVVVISHDSKISEFTSKVLLHNGIHAVCAENVNEALKQFNNFKRQNDLCKRILLVDELSDHIENISEISDIAKIFVLTSDNNSIKNFTGCGFTILNKPLTPTELVHKIINFETPEEIEKIKKLKFKDAKVLLVEDNELNLKVFSEILEIYGIKNDKAENGFKAIEMSENKNYDLIFMDVQMPDINGYQTTEKIRKNGIDTTIVALTANAYSSDVSECLNAGMDDHLAKPVIIKSLEKILQKYLSNFLENAEKKEDCFLNQTAEFVTEFKETYEGAGLKVLNLVNEKKYKEALPVLNEIKDIAGTFGCKELFESCIVLINKLTDEKIVQPPVKEAEHFKNKFRECIHSRQ